MPHPSGPERVPVSLDLVHGAGCLIESSETEKVSPSSPLDLCKALGARPDYLPGPLEVQHPTVLEKSS